MDELSRNSEAARKDVGAGRVRRLHGLDVFLVVLLVLCGVVTAGGLAWPSVVAWMNRPQAGVQVAARWEALGGEGDRTPAIKYLLYLPEEYGGEKRQWPTVAFLHGAGERGNDIEKLKRCGPPGLVSGGGTFPFVLVSPQCPSHETWEPPVLLRLIDHVVEKHEIDPERVYVTGYSLGGYGTWSLAVAAPERFAAIAPLAGGGDTRQAAT
jgi:pimeloyl-ACP methyl ester carboxylesterase